MLIESCMSLSCFPSSVSLSPYLSFQVSYQDDSRDLDNLCIISSVTSAHYFSVPSFHSSIHSVYNNLGYQWASTLAGLLGAVLGLAPFILMWKGKEIRAKSKFSQELQRLQEAKEKESM